MEFKVSDMDDWLEVSDQILSRLQHRILLIKGNLGAGKTTFTQILLRGMGSQDEVSSPTYAIVNEYHSPKGKVFHFDLYRMKNADEVEDIGIHEYLEEAFLCIIEWPEVYEEELTEFPHHLMTIESDGTERKITFC